MKLHHLTLTLPLAAAVFMTCSSASMAASPTASFSFGVPSGGAGYHDPDYQPDDDECLTEWQIVRELRKDGYRNVRLIDDDDDTLVFLARNRSRTYQLVIDACDGDVLARTRVRVR